jgi:hypothetical protein
MQQLFGSLQRAPAWRDPHNPEIFVWKLLAEPASSSSDGTGRNDQLYGQ